MCSCQDPTLARNIEILAIFRDSVDQNHAHSRRSGAFSAGRDRRFGDRGSLQTTHVINR